VIYPQAGTGNRTRKFQARGYIMNIESKLNSAEAPANDATPTPAAAPTQAATAPAPKRTPNEARRINATLSCGPKTEAGKATSKLNATRHFLCGRTILGSTAELEQHRLYSDELKNDLRPVGALETTLVQNMADAQFQLDRTRAMEQNLFFESALKHTDEDDETRDFDADYDQGQAFTFEAKSKQLDLLARYGNRFQRQILQNQSAFYKARDERYKEEALQAKRDEASRSLDLATARQEINAKFRKHMEARAAGKPIPKSSFVRQNQKPSVSDAEYNTLKAQVEADMAYMDERFGKL